MIRPRLIPSLLVHNGGLVKTVRFKEPKYLGDPLNAVRIFNEMEADELFVADIDATVEELEPNYELIQSLAMECRMPLCYAGGVHQAAQIERIVSLGVEKVAIGTAAMSNPALIRDSASRVGSQSVAVVLNVKRTGPLRRYEVVTHRALRRTGESPDEAARRLTALGAGEVIVNSVDRDGTMAGYDDELIGLIRRSVQVPVTALGGAANLEDIRGLVDRHPLVGACAGSIFCLHGKYRAALIQYPSLSERNRLFASRSTR